MSIQLFTLIPQSNLHAGAGSSNYGVIDNLVQRDVTDQYPCVYATSLKGAFREHYEEVLGKSVLKNNKKDGHGVYYWAGGSIYEGDWKGDKIHGKGVMRHSNGKV